MSKISKNLLLALTLVCVIVLIIFCVELIVLNRNVDPAERGSTASEKPSAEEEDPDGDPTGEEQSGDTDGTGESGASGENGTNGSGDDAQRSPRPTPVGKRYELPMPHNMKLELYAKDELFDYIENDLDWWFVYSGGGIASLEISFTVTSPHGIAADAETYLNNYTEGDNSTGGGEEQIKGSPLRGYYVSAERDGEMYEAWLHSLPASEFAIVFVISYRDDQQKNALYEVLDSLDIMSA